MHKPRISKDPAMEIKKSGSQASIQKELDGNAVTWLERVSDEQYHD